MSASRAAERRRVPRGCVSCNDSFGAIGRYGSGPAGAVVAEATELVVLGEHLFRPAASAFDPDRYAFDTIVEGHALRLLWSGMPMYRVDDR